MFKPSSPFLSLLLAAALSAGAAPSAHAVEVKASGVMEILFESAHNIASANRFQDYDDNGSHQKHFSAVQKLKLSLDFVLSESLSARYTAQAGAFTWGGPTSPSYSIGAGNASEASGGALGSRAANIVTKEAYLDWMIPGTDARVRMGQQFLMLPGFAFPNPVLGNWGTGVAVSAPATDSLRLNAFWLRAYSDFRRGTVDNAAPGNDNLDLVSLAANYRIDGFQATPWLMAGRLGDAVTNFNQPYNSIYVKNGLLPVTGYEQFGRAADGHVVSLGLAPSDSTLWFGGLSLELTRFAPLRLALDAYYSASINAHRSTERSGWFVGGSAEYETPWGVPAFKAWYASGDNGDLTDGSERALGVRGGFTPGAPVLFNSFAYGLSETSNRGEAAGTWGASLQWNAASFVPRVFHSLRATYVQGTNNPNMARYAVNSGPALYMTRRDHAVELDLDTTISIYANLAAMLELSYVFQDFDGEVWRNLPGTTGAGASFSDAWRAGLTFTYTF
ncbi:MAG: outer membrane homotrimeric porin [Desulfovibrionaceae bacterium]|nr:outer membrane homotrimeric porin [Desulfovibrionaceae bacterium]